MIGLTEVQASLTLFAEAIAGESVPFSTATDRRGCWPWALHRAEAEVVLPIELHSRTAYRSVLLHQLLCTPVPAGPRPLFDELLRLVEDHRVVAAVRRGYPGAVPAQIEVLADAAADALAAAPAVADAMSPVAELVHCLLLRTLDVDEATIDRALPDVPAATVRVLVGLIDRVRVPATDAGTSRRVAEELYALLGAGPGTRRVLEPIDEPADESGDEVDGGSGVSLDGGTPSEVVDGDSGGSGRLSSDLGDASVAAADEDDERPGGLELATTPAQGSVARDVRTFVYDEWDYHRASHRRAWCRVSEERLIGDDHGFIHDVRERHAVLRARLRRSLARMPPQELVRVRRSLDGDEIDLDAAIEAVSDRRSGAPVDDRVAIRRDRAARDVAIAFLVDLSASTSSPAVTPEPQPVEVADPMDDPLSYGSIWDPLPDAEPVRRVIDVAKDAVALMGDALEELGDRFAIYGFSGTGREGVEFKIGKDFADRCTPATWAAVAAMKPLRYTRMGPAVRHAATKLTAERARTKLLVVVSDGYPQDTDYGHDRTDRDYGIHDTARALADATESGIETFCVTIDPAGHDYLRDMCPDERYVVIDDVESLPERLAAQLIELRR